MANKKSFMQDLDNTAELFISKPKQDEETEQAEIPSGKPPKGYKLNPLYIETRNKRFQLLLQPSLLTKLKEKAAKENRSVNDLIHSILEKAVK